MAVKCWNWKFVDKKKKSGSEYTLVTKCAIVNVSTSTLLQQNQMWNEGRENAVIIYGKKKN